MAFDLDEVARPDRPETAAVIAVHIGGLISPDVPALAALCARARRRRWSRMRPTRTAVALDGRAAGTFGIAGAFSLLPDQGHGRRRGRHDRHRRRDIDEEARDLPRPGQGSVHCRTSTPASAANWRMSEPHAAIVHAQLRRLDEFIAARQTHRQALRRGDRVDRAAAVRHSARTRTATTTSTSRSCPTASTAPTSSRRCANGSTSACRARCTTRRCTTSRCSSPLGPTDALPGAEWTLRAPHLPAALSVARRSRRRLRHRVARHRARRARRDGVTTRSIVQTT